MARWILVLIIAAVLGTCAIKPGSLSERSPGWVGTARLVQGMVWLERSGKSQPLRAGDFINIGDWIRTGPKAILIATFQNRTADIELQENSNFHVTRFDKTQRLLTLEKGRLWLRVNRKMKKHERFQLKTAVALIGVKGTKFFSFPLGDIYGTCHCEGQVQWDAQKSDYTGIHKKDFMTFARGDKVALVTPDELRSVGFTELVHFHSALEDSPLGPTEMALPPDLFERFLALINRKLEEVE